MFPNNIEFMASEHRKDLMQEAEHIRLVKTAGVQQFNYGEASRKIVNWVGSQMVKLGAKLQSQRVAPSPKVSSMNQRF